MAKVDRTKIPLNCFVRATQQNETILLKRKISIGNKLIKVKRGRERVANANGVYNLRLVGELSEAEGTCKHLKEQQI